MKGEGAMAKQISDLFAITARRAGLHAGSYKLNAGNFRRDKGAQLEFAYGS